MIRTSLLILIFINASQAIYDEVYDCSDNENTDEEKSQILLLPDIDKYILAIGAPIAFTCTIFITITFFIFPQTRKPPGDIILMISLCDCILSIHWFMFAMYSIYYDVAPLPNGNFCQVNAFFSIMAGTGEYIYNIAFCLYLRLTLTQVLKVQTKMKMGIHTICLAILIGIPSWAIRNDKTGLNLYGTCSFKQNNEGFLWGGPILVGSYMIISIYTICFFKYTIPASETLLIKKEKFMQYYFKYIISSCVIWTTLAVSNIMVDLNCQYFKRRDLEIFITIGNTAKLATPIVLSIMRYHDPTIHRKILKVIRGFLQYEQIPRSQVSSQSINDVSFFDQIANDLKSQLVTSIIYGVRKAYIDIYEEPKNPNKIDGSNKNLHSFKVQDSSINKDSENDVSLQVLTRNKGQTLNKKQSLEILKDEYQLDEADFNSKDSFEIKGQGMMEMKVTVYAAKAYNLLVKRDRLMVDPIASLEPLMNIQQLKKFTNPEGGKSGEFFFFTNDDRLILKTMSQYEFDALIYRLPQYIAHLMRNDSMITPIYGVFQFERIGQKFNGFSNEVQIVFLQRNISQSPSRYKLRTFDMKGFNIILIYKIGSELAREVLAKMNPDTDISQLTLKDTDFFKLEGTIKIEKIKSTRVREALIRDANFFIKMELMDYSLLVFIIDWRLFLIENKNLRIEDIINRFSFDLNLIEHTEQPGVFYHIAVIDYLQQWTHQKKLEKVGKQFTQELDPSAQDPIRYGNRFQDKLVYQIFI